MSQIRRTKCPRCNGCGRIGGAGHREQPWNSFGNVPPHVALEKIMGMYRPRGCPDCGETGTVASGAPTAGAGPTFADRKVA